MACSVHSVTQLWLIWKSLIKNKSLNTKPCPAGLPPRIICQPSPFFPKMSQNCCTIQVATVPPSPKPLWETLGMRKNPTEQPKNYSFAPSEKSSLIDLNLSLSKVSFLPHQALPSKISVPFLQCYSKTLLLLLFSSFLHSPFYFTLYKISTDFTPIEILWLVG